MDLNTRVKTINLREENEGVNLRDLGLGNNFLDTTPKSCAPKEKKRQIGLHQHLKLLCFEEHHRETETTTRGMGETFESHSPSKRLVSKNPCR